MSQHVIENNTPVVVLECRNAFERLTDREKAYAHHLSQAAWIGSLITLYQTSKESPTIFSLLHRLFSHDTVADLKEMATGSAGFTDDDFTALLVYAASVLSNMGNYKGFGDLKFVPNVDANKLEKLLTGSTAAQEDPAILRLWQDCQKAMYSLEPNEKSLGFPPKGTTTYFTEDCCESDSHVVQEMMIRNKIEGYNNRIFKRGDGTFELRFASIRSTNDTEEADFLKNYDSCDGKLLLTRGDYAPILEQVVIHLNKAKEFAANDNEKRMLEEYVRSFRSGDLSAHKEGSRYWIKDKKPVVETYIGFIETYRDPAGMRGEFEAFVSLVDKERTKAFGSLVANAESLLSLLPWGKSFEKDQFLQPDFTSLDVLTFAGSGIPAGINIPNYKEITQNEGFKNVSLGNVISSSMSDLQPNFLSVADASLMMGNLAESFEVQVGLHELLGHGSGKLFRKTADGSYNFELGLLNPITGQPISGWYEEGQTYDSQFRSLGSAFEECRAECVGLYLCLEKSVVRIFGFEGEKADEVIHANWLSMVHKGIESLKMYQPETKKWLQAHSQARYVITRVLIEKAAGLVSITSETGADGEPDLLINFDAAMIHESGKAAIGNFLLQLQVLKGTADSEAAEQLFAKYSEVSDELEYPYLKFREITVRKRKPRKIFVQGTTELTDTGAVRLIEHPATLHGVVQSFISNFPEPLVSSLYEKMAVRQ